MFSNKRKSYGSYSRHASGTHVSTKRPTSTLIEEVRHRKRRKHLLIGAALVVAVLAIAIVVGVIAYFNNTNAKLDLSPSNAADALVDASDDSAIYVLCSAYLGRASSAPASYDIPENTQGYMLVRADISNRTLSFVSIPANTLVRFSDGEYRPLYKATEEGGEAELINRVAEFADVDINHFVRTTAEGISSLVDLVGGVPCTLSAEIDDPYAGNEVLFSGDTVLDGKQALVFLRAKNVLGGWETVAANRVNFTRDLLATALDSTGLNLAAVVSDASNYVDTDMSASEIMELADAFRPLNTATVYSCVVPGLDATTPDGLSAFDPETSEWASMMDRMRTGEDPNAPEASEQNVDKGATTVEVRNGTQTPGAAAQMASILESDGFKVEGVGNTDDSTTYKETLVVYMEPEFEGAAKAVVRTIGGGRTVYGGDFYRSESDIIAIVGTDWMP